MTYPSEERIAEYRRCEERARAILKPGDRLLVGICGNGAGVTVTMTGWSSDYPGYITSKSLDGDELHPYNICKVNGAPVCFRDREELGPLERIALDYLASGIRTATHFIVNACAFHSNPSAQRVRRMLHRLAKRGLVEPTMGGQGACWWNITDAGREAVGKRA